MRTILQLLPWVTLLALALASIFSPALTAALEYDRSSADQPWRLLTCHFTHWSPDHLLWSAGTFAALSFVAYRTAPRLGLACVTTAALTVTLTISCGTHLTHYRGLSGIDSALFALLATLFLFDNLAARQTPRALASAALLLALAAKLAYECLTHSALFVRPDPAGVTPVPLAHAAGAVTGLVLAAGAQRAPGANLIRNNDCQPPPARG
jgi:rhomboid family GlyGly-CTERM serine protease